MGCRLEKRFNQRVSENKGLDQPVNRPVNKGQKYKQGYSEGFAQDFWSAVHGFIVHYSSFIDDLNQIISNLIKLDIYFIKANIQAPKLCTGIQEDIM